MVPNPMKAALEQVLKRAQRALDDIMDITGPAETIGVGQGWTGSVAQDTYDHSLAPAANDISTSRTDLITDIETSLGAMDDLVPEDVAELMQAELNSR